MDRLLATSVQWKHQRDAGLEGHSLSYTKMIKHKEFCLEHEDARNFKLFPSKPCLVTSNGIRTTTNSCHILTGLHRRSKHRQQVTHNDIHTATNSSSDEKIKRLQTLRLSQQGHTTVGGNIAHPVAHQVELLTLTAFSSCIRESELVTQQWEEDIDSNLAKDLSMIEG